VSTDDLRILEITPLSSPARVIQDVPCSLKAIATVKGARETVHRILHGEDDRLIVIVGPCSIHDPVAALDYAARLLERRTRHAHDLEIIMRVYFEKPRTTVGWKGLINDPDLDGSFKIEDGLRIARKLLVDINDLGLPAGCELLDTITPQYIADLISWGRSGRGRLKARSTVNWRLECRARWGSRMGPRGTSGLRSTRSRLHRNHIISRLSLKMGALR
jgi:3-deoxy-7-phosphoheptulonate synthase